MPFLSREHKNLFSNWWWTIDRLTMISTLLIMVFGGVMVATASPAVAERIGLEPYYFVKHQLLYMVLALLFMFGLSLLSTQYVQKVAWGGIAVTLFLMVVVLLFGSETKGAQRWLNILGISLQPSEFVKPFFAVCAAGLLAQTGGRYTWKEMRFSLLLYGLIILLLILQPDFGMALTISVIWGGQLFIAGLPMVLVISMMFIGFIGMIAAYHFLPHVTYRVNSFLGTDSETTYQVKKSIEAFQHGGLFGRGPGEGTVKQHLPDSHTDFIFAVAGEELGALVCMLLVVLYAIIVLRGLYRLQEQRDLFLVYSIAGLLIIIGAQAVVNMGVALHLFPTKGMTLPFISYGGSSMLSISIAMGMIFALTRRRYGKILKRGPGI